MSPPEVIDKRYEFVLLFDVSYGNPNGDPDAGNAPRMDPESGCGLVTDVCLKRKIRNFVAMTRDYQPPYDIYVKERGILAREQRRAYQAIQAEPLDRPNEQARQWMCRNFFDVRTFGAVMTTGRFGEESGQPRRKNHKLWNCGQVRGPVQIAFGRSLSPVAPLEHTITPVALTNAGDSGAGEADGIEEKAASGQMGRKHTIPYALYRAHGFISPFLARDTGFSKDDLEVLFSALVSMFEHDRSASRGEMAVRGLYVFEHESQLGNAPAHRLFEQIRIEGPQVPRSFKDYKVDLPLEPGSLPDGVRMAVLV